VSAPVRVVGIGSAWGADRVGWDVAERLAAALPPDLEVARCDSPAALLGLLEGAQRAVLVDAVVTGAAPGTVGRWAGREVLEPRAAWSSHGLDVAGMLALGEALGALPAELVLYGIEVDPQACAPGQDAGALETSVAEAAARIRAELAAAQAPGGLD
jgi:hydrogenase maturation protease